MRIAIVAFLFFIVIALLSGTVTFPTRDEFILVFASLSLLIVSWLYKREERALKEKKDE